MKQYQKRILLCLLCTLTLCSAAFGCGKNEEEIQNSNVEHVEDTTEVSQTTKEETTETSASTAQTTEAATETETTVVSETETTTETSAVTETQETVSETSAETTEPPTDEIPPTEPPTPAAGFSAADLAFTYNGSTLTVGQDAAAFISAVPANFSESAPSCYGDGNDINYYYLDFTLYIWDSNGKQLTYGIDLTGDGVSTSKGISLGSSVNDVIAAYGSNYNVEAMDYVYTDGNYNLRFTIMNDTVTYISYNYNL